MVGEIGIFVYPTYFIKMIYGNPLEQQEHPYYYE